MTMRWRHYATLPNIVSFLVLLTFLPPLYWWILDRQPAASSISEIVSPTVKQGGLFQIRYKVVWNSSCTITAFRYVIDNMRVEWPISSDTRRVQEGPAEFTINIPIPLAAAPGKAQYKATLLYECNPVQRFFPLEQVIQTREFEIMPGDNPSTGITQSSIRDGMTAPIVCPEARPVFVKAYCRRRMALTMADP